MTAAPPDPPFMPDGLDGQVEHLYVALRKLARRTVRGRTGQRVLEPTELVHELYMKLARHQREGVSRAQFLSLAATVLRGVLVDHVRELATLKRGGAHRHVTLSGQVIEQRDEVDILALHDALNRLATLDPRLARIVELRFFAGLELEEIAAVIGTSPRTVDKDWALAKAWLHREMAP